jgi:hypothetical protein
MIELLTVVLIACAGSFWGGWKYREYVARQNIQMYQDLLEGIIKESKARTIEIKVDKHADSILVYDKQTNEFLVQGKTHTEVLENLSKRFPGTLFVADDATLKEFNYHERI